MATVRLRQSELDDLPDLCMFCGDDAALERKQRFFWAPMEENVRQIIAVMLRASGFIRLRLSNMRSMTVKVPLCARHQRHFLWTALLQYVGLLIFVLLGFVVGFAIFNAPDSVDEMRRQAAGLPPDPRVWLFRGALALFFAWPIFWLIILVKVQWSTIRPVRITDKAITLTNVAREFAEEMETER